MLPALKGPSASIATRITAGVVCAALLAVLIVAAGLEPNTKGHGTHTQLGMPACGWVLAFSKPCPTCGMTTSFAHAANLDLWHSLKVQPGGALLAILAAIGVWPAFWIAFTGSQLAPVLGILTRPRIVWVFVGLVFVAWMYKIAIWPAR
jgi:hypothetical protein